MDLSYSMALSIRWVQPSSILLITETQTPGVCGSHTAVSAYPLAWLPSLDVSASPLSWCPEGDLRSLCPLQAAMRARAYCHQTRLCPRPGSSYHGVWNFSRQQWSPGGPSVNNPPASTGDRRDAGSIPGWGRSPGGGHGNPLQYSCLENPMDRGAWQATPWGRKESDMTEAT